MCRQKTSFDFYLPDYNTLIEFEFDGMQHFKNRNFFHKGRETFENRIYKNKLKLKFILENKIALLRITYEEIDIINFILGAIIYNRAEDPFLFDMKNNLSEKKTRRHYINQYDENCKENNIPVRRINTFLTIS